MIASFLVVALAQSPSPALVGPTGQLALQSGMLSPPLAGAPQDAVLRYALARRTELGLPARSTLAVGPMFSTRFGGSAHLVQQVDGLEVRGGKVIVTVDEKMRVVRLASSVKRFGDINLDARLGGKEALEIASHQIDGALLKSDGTPFGGWRKLAFVVEGALHVGYLTFVPTLSASESWHVAIDATDGAVLYLENRVHSANDGAVYAQAPVNGVGTSPTTTLALPHLGATPGPLAGELIVTTNCCPTLNCNLTPGAPAKRAVGQMQTFGGLINYDMAVCDQHPIASNDPAVHASGNYVYAPVDPPTSQFPSNTSLADFDAFAEVNAYLHVNRTYDLLRGFSYGPLTADGGFTPFKMRDYGNGKLPVVWVNASEVDWSSAQVVDGGYVGNRLARVDNAMFVARELMDSLSVPEVRTDSDLLVVYQGNAADFAYDGPVVSHEFGHGVIHSTANWDYTIAIDSRSANDESGALHEGWADIIAAITNNDPVVGGYVGPRIDPTSNAIRTLDNTAVCPNVLWGESHQDSQHFTGAVWHARQTFFLGSDQGRTYDAALFAALVSFPPDVNFEKAANIVIAQVAQAFPQMADAQDKIRGEFLSRGVLNCSKVLDVTTDRAPRTYYAISGSALANLNPGTPVPGPYQFKIHVPDGARSVSISGPYFGGRGRADGGTTTTPSATIKLLARVNTPITFTPNASGSTLLNDADVSVTPTLPVAGQMTGTAAIAVPCGGDLYFTLANTSTRDRTMANLAFSYEPADSCPPPPPPPPDPQPVEIAAAPAQLGKAPAGCGCSAMPLGSVLVALLPLARRRRRRG